MSDTRTMLRRLAIDDAVSQMTMRQAAILAILSEVDGGLDYLVVVRELRASKPAITRAADKLEADQLLARRPHPADQRKVMLSLTERGQKFVAGRLA